MESEVRCMCNKTTTPRGVLNPAPETVGYGGDYYLSVVNE